MKHLNRFLSVILTVAMLLTVAPFTVGAETSSSFDNVAVLYDESFDSLDPETASIETDLKNIIEWQTKATYNLENSIVSASGEAIDDAANHGNVILMDKAQSDTAEDNYVRLYYRNAALTSGYRGVIDGKFEDTPQALSNVKTSVDIYWKDAIEHTLNMRYYDNISGKDANGKGFLKAENLVEISNKGVVTLADGTTIDGLTIVAGNWYTFDIELDFTKDTYSVAINDTTYAQDVDMSTLDTCVTAFGMQQGNLKKASKIYIDNMYFAASIAPENTNTVWENDFDSIQATNGELPSGTSTENNATIDYRPENATWSIKAEDGNQYYYFQPKGTSVANSGNRLDGYFETSEEEVREAKEYVTDSDGNIQYDSKGNPKVKSYYSGIDYPHLSGFSSSPYLIDRFKLDKFRLDFSIKLSSTFEMQVCPYYRGTMYGAFNSAHKILWFRNDGTIDLGNGSGSEQEEVYTYTAGQWMNVTMYVDCVEHIAYYIIDNTYVGSAPINETIAYFNQVRFRIDAVAADATFSDYGVSLDNIRYSTTYSEKYINREYDKKEIARLDFVNEPAGVINGTEADASKHYFVDTSNSVTVVNDTEKGHNVAFLDKISTKHKGFGMPAATLQATDIYKEYSKYPQHIRIEAGLKRVGSTAVYMRVDGVEILRISGNCAIQYPLPKEEDVVDGTVDGITNTTDKIIENEWFNIALDLDFENRKVAAYYNDNCIRKYNMPEGIDSPENIDFSSLSKENNLYLDYISIQVLPPYGSDSLCEYLDWNANFNVGYAMNNDDDAAAAHKLIVAKFDSNDNLVEISAIEDKTVAAGAYSVCTTPALEGDDGEYYKYFVWEDLETIKPLLSNEIVK